MYYCYTCNYRRKEDKVVSFVESKEILIHDRHMKSEMLL